MCAEIVYHMGSISQVDRQKLYGHRSVVIWLTGLSASGKSTLAYALERELYQQGIHSYVLDGDNLRYGLNQDLEFSTEDRKENIRRLAQIGKLFVDAGVIVIVAAISPFQDDRQKAKQLFKDGEFIEVYVKCPLEQCIIRDPKGLYQKAKDAKISQFTGVSSPYEPPLNADITVETDTHSVEECVNKIKEYMKELITVSDNLQ
jgi:adenylylsulfate kinase